MTDETTAEVAVEKTDEVVENVEVAPQADAVVEAPVAEEVAKSDEVAATEEVAKADEAPATEEVAKSDDEAPASAPADITEVSKSDDVIVEAVTEMKSTITSAFSDLIATVKSLQAEVEMLKSSKVDTDAVKSSLEEVAKDIATTREQFNNFGKRVDAVEADTAFRKSGDLGEIIQEQSEMVEKSLWGGRFLKTADLFN